MWGRTSVEHQSTLCSSWLRVSQPRRAPWLCPWGCYATAESGFLMKCTSFILFTYNRSFILKGCVTFTLNHEHHTADATQMSGDDSPALSFCLSFVLYVSIFLSLSWLMIRPSWRLCSGWTLITCFRFGTSYIPEYLSSHSWNINPDSGDFHDNLFPVNTVMLSGFCNGQNQESMRKGTSGGAPCWVRVGVPSPQDS